MTPLWVITQADVLNTANKVGMLSLKKKAHILWFSQLINFSLFLNGSSSPRNQKFTTPQLFYELRNGEYLPQ